MATISARPRLCTRCRDQNYREAKALRDLLDLEIRQKDAHERAGAGDGQVRYRMDRAVMLARTGGNKIETSCNHVDYDTWLKEEGDA